MWARVCGLGRDWAELIFPAWCPVCGGAARGVCAACVDMISAASVQRSSVSVAGFDMPIFSSAESESCRRIVAGLKDADRFDVVPTLAAVLEQTIAQASAGRAVVAVPIPSSRRALRHRGYWPLGVVLARCRFPENARISVRGVEWTRRTRDQRGLDWAKRRANLEGALVCADPALPGAMVVIVDDVVTTGATVRSAAAALIDAGAVVVAVAAIARVDRRGDRRELSVVSQGKRE